MFGLLRPLTGFLTRSLVELIALTWSNVLRDIDEVHML